MEDRSLTTEHVGAGPLARRIGPLGLRLIRKHLTRQPVRLYIEIPVTGNDELTDLGRALNEMVKRRTEYEEQENAQAEFGTRCSSPRPRRKRSSCSSTSSSDR